jgi:hypothetical protein
MYNIIRQTHENYGYVIVIERTADNKQITPLQAVREAIKQQKLWSIESSKKVRILIDNQIMSPQQAECWAKEEYNTLPKCKWCAKLLNEDVITHQLSIGFFCSQDCADKDYNNQLEISQDEEEVEL